jgi:hypothetical protein
MLPLAIIKKNPRIFAQLPCICELIRNYPGYGKLPASAKNAAISVNPAEPGFLHIG